MAAAETDVEERKEGKPDDEDIEEQIDSEKDEHDDGESFEEDREDEEVIVASSDREEKYSDQERLHKEMQGSSETEVKSSADKEKVLSFTQDRER